LGHSLVLGREAISVAPHEVRLGGGERISAACVIDARGFPPRLPKPCGFQKFLGLELELEAPHGLDGPLLMDATCEQREGFRFFYSLPWSERTLLVEDTRYCDRPELDADELRGEIRAYAERNGWRIRAIGREEVGCLPIPLGRWGNPARAMALSGVPTIGVRAGLFHATTGYSLPEAVRLAGLLARDGLGDTESTLRFLSRHASACAGRQRFFRLLNRMLFRGAAPARRYEVLQRFYRMPEPLVQRFYAAELGPADWVRILTGRPPIPVGRALACLWESLGERGEESVA
jgi:lycopene beta-cyclase